MERATTTGIRWNLVDLSSAVEAEGDQKRSAALFEVQTEVGVVVEASRILDFAHIVVQEAAGVQYFVVIVAADRKAAAGAQIEDLL